MGRFVRSPVAYLAAVSGMQNHFFFKKAHIDT